MHYWCFLLVCGIAATSATDLGIELLSQNHDSPTNEGTLFAVGFLNNAPNAAPLSTAILYVLNKNSMAATVEVSLPHNPTFPDYPQTISIGPNSKHVFKFSTTGSADVRVVNEQLLSLNKGIRVRSTNNVPVTVIGSNSESKSTDAFLALPCQTVDINKYKYFLFAAEGVSSETSQFVVVACEDGTDISSSTTISGTSISASLSAFQSYGVSASSDITGTIIESNKPVAVFSGHQCGRIPTDKSACDHLVEQIPMHAVWGTTFFTTPFGYRGSGEFYRVGSILDGNKIDITCNRRTAAGTSTQIRITETVNAGNYYQLETHRVQVGSPLVNYRRDFCCIETSKPAIVMQYMPGHSLDETNVNGIGSGVGDPSISLIPPVEQYRSDFTATTFDITPIVETFTNMISWTIPSRFFNPSTNANEVFFDNAVLNPGSMSPSQGGSGEYVPIECSNGEICGYGAFAPSPLGATTNQQFSLQFNSSKNAYAGINFQLYGYVPEMSYAYPAGFEMEPIGIPRITVYNLTVREDAGTITIPFNRTGGDLSTNSRIFAQTRSINGQAVVGSDYTAVDSTKLRFQPNQVDLNPKDPPFTVTILDDESAEPTEYFEVFFTIDVNGYPFPGVARITILDDDSKDVTVNFDPDSYTVTEGASAMLTVVLNSPSDQEVTVQVGTTDGTATNNLDYTGGVQTLTFAAGTTTATVTIPTSTDNIDEVTERFTARLMNPQGATVGSTDTSTVDITDINVVTVMFDPDSYTVTEGGSTMATVVLSGPSTRTITVDVASSGGTATDSDDYTTVSRTLTFQPGVTSVSFPVMASTDQIDEVQEEFSITLSNPTNDAMLGSDDSAMVFIDDGNSVTVMFDPDSYTVTEGGSTMATVVLSGPSTRTITVDVASSGGTATDSDDYTTVSRTLTFQPGTTSVSFPVTASTDQIDEVQEEFSISLSNPTNDAMLGSDDRARVFIDDGNTVTVMFDPDSYTVTEGGSTTATVVLSGPSTRTITVDVASSGGTATDSDDYTTVSRTLTFQPGTTSVSFPVTTSTDQIAENQEEFSITLSNPTNDAMLGSDDSAMVFIDDGNSVTVMFDPDSYTVTEGGSTTATVVLSGPSTRTITVDVASSGGTATDSDDYTTVSRTLTFQPGATSVSFPVTASTDLIDEDQEEFSITLSNPTNDAMLGSDDSAMVFIDDGNSVTVMFDPDSYTVTEGGSTTATVVLSGPSTRTITVDVASSGGTATDSDDYTTVSRTLTFQPGTTSVSFPVTASTDQIDEVQEDFSISLSNPTNDAVVGSDDSAMVFIDDGNSLVVNFVPTTYQVTEGSSVQITAMLNNPADRDVTVDFTTVPGTALDTSDYTPVTRTLTFPRGQTTSTISIVSTQDEVQEGPEQFTATLTNPTSGLQIGSSDTATVTIRDDDVISVNFDPTSYVVNEGDSTNVRVVLSNPSSSAITVELFTEVGTAGSDDFTGFTQTVTFSPGVTVVTVPVSSTEDSRNENDENFSVMLRNPSGQTQLGPDSEAGVTIVDDDVVVVQLDMESYTVTEGDSVSVNVVTDRISDRDITVTLVTSDGPATAPDDYTVTTQVVTIPAGQTSTTVMIPTTEDNIVELTESFEVTLSNPNPSGEVVLGPRDDATVQIEDDDDIVINIEREDYSVVEDKGPVEVCIVLSNPADRDVVVTGRVAPLTNVQAEEGDDFVGGSITFQVPAGNVRACQNVTVVDDSTVEPAESFQVILDPPSSPLDIKLGNRPDAEVVIIDDDSFTANIEQPSYTVRENETFVEVCATLSNPSSQDQSVTATLRPTDPPQARAGEDYVNETITFSFMARENRACSRVTIVDNDIAERPEEFVIVINPPSNPDGPAPGGRSTSTITIEDDDDLIVNIERETYDINESDGPLEVCATLSNPASEDVTVTAIARESDSPEARDVEDFEAGSVSITFRAGQTRACGLIPIVDDNVREMLTEMFTVDLVVPPSQPLTPRPGPRTSVPVEIEDDDSVSVRFVDDNPVVNENNGTATICLERVGPSQEDITLVLSAEESSPPDARDGVDFTATTTSVTIRAGQSISCASVPIIDDNVAMEPNRTFQIAIDPPRGVTPPGRGLVTIRDDDVVRVSWETPEIVVSEDEGSRMVCFTTDRPSFSPFTVVVTSRGATSNPATFGMDYQTSSRDISVVVPAGPAGRHCVDLTINDDDIALEDEESLVFTFEQLPPGVEVGPVPESTIKIVDNDVVAVEFQSPNVTVNENDGTAMVCVERNATTEENMVVSVVTSFGSAGDSDLESVIKDVVFTPSQRVSCIAVTIKNDQSPEPQESFTVGFNPRPGMSRFVTPSGDTATTTVIIMDDDFPTTTACVIQDALRVSPFNARPSYQFRGTCELIAVQSCNSTRPDFSVRVDYITDNFDAGAIGVFKDNLRWVVREDRTFSTNSSETPSVSGNATTYVNSGVTVTRGNDMVVIAVEDGIGVRISRSFADDGTIMISVASDSSLLESCGVCGTQNGELLSLDGQITPVGATLEQTQAFVNSYRVPVSDHFLRPVRPECAVVRNGSVIGDPLFTVPIGKNDMHLCYEIHGSSNTIFNIISDECVNVNARYAAVGGLNVMDSIAIRAEGDSGTCRDIRVDLENCATSVSPMGGGSLTSLDGSLEQDGISVRPIGKRVRISVPNCDNLHLVMWVTCYDTLTPAQLKLHVMRGVNLRPTSHGLLGQFWNIPISVEPLPGFSDRFNVTFQPQDGSGPRSAVGEVYKATWENLKQPCLYMGNSQGGPAGLMEDIDDSIIRGSYKDYRMEDLFDTSYGYAKWNSDCTAN